MKSINKGLTDRIIKMIDTLTKTQSRYLGIIDDINRRVDLPDWTLKQSTVYLSDAITNLVCLFNNLFEYEIGDEVYVLGNRNENTADIMEGGMIFKFEKDDQVCLDTGAWHKIEDIRWEEKPSEIYLGREY